MRLNVLEICNVEAQRGPRAAVAAMVRLAQVAEECGYHRFWIGEHHVKAAATAAPDLLIPLIASKTTTIRVGVAGVLLNLRSHFEVAERYAFLSRVFDGRIDLGMARGRPPDVVESSLMQDWGEARTSYKSRVAALVDTFRAAPEHLVPAPGDLELWLHGSGTTSASIARKLDVPYCHALFLPGEASVPDQATTVAVAGVCAPNMERAFTLASTSANNRLNATVLGGPKQCAEMLLELQANNPQIEEVVFLDLATKQSDHIGSYVAIAEAFNP